MIRTEMQSLSSLSRMSFAISTAEMRWPAPGAGMKTSSAFVVIEVSLSFAGVVIWCWCLWYEIRFLCFPVDRTEYMKFTNLLLLLLSRKAIEIEKDALSLHF